MEITTTLLQSLILPAGIVAVLFAIWLANDVLGRDRGTKAMQEVAGTIFEGAVAFMRRQYFTIAALAVVGSVAIGALISVFAARTRPPIRSASARPMASRCSGSATGIASRSSAMLTALASAMRKESSRRPSETSIIAVT